MSTTPFSTLFGWTNNKTKFGIWLLDQWSAQPTNLWRNFKADRCHVTSLIPCKDSTLGIDFSRSPLLHLQAGLGTS